MVRKKFTTLRSLTPGPVQALDWSVRVMVNGESRLASGKATKPLSFDHSGD